MILKYSGALWVAVAGEGQESGEIDEEEFTCLRLPLAELFASQRAPGERSGFAAHREEQNDETRARPIRDDRSAPCRTNIEC